MVHPKRDPSILESVEYHGVLIFGESIKENDENAGTIRWPSATKED